MSGKMFNQFECSRLILPEHRNMLYEDVLREAREENYKDTVKPDEQEQEKMAALLNDSLTRNREVTISVLTKKGIESISGVVKNCFYPDIIIKKGLGSTRKLAMASIIRVEVPEGAE